VGKGGRFLNADAVTIIEPGVGRTTPMCEWAGRCGGCDFQHVDAETQRQLKCDVIADVLARIGKIDEIDGMPARQALALWPAAASPEYGRGSRTRIRYTVSAEGQLCMRAHHSHDLVAVGACPLGDAELTQAAQQFAGAKAGDEVEFIHDDDNEVITVINGEASEMVTRRVGQRHWRLQATGFWQVHPEAGEWLTSLVLKGANCASGDRVLDLYAGAGLFTAALAEAVGLDGHVDAVESAVDSVNDGATALADLSNVTFHCDDVKAWLADHPSVAADVVVMDPPRAGVGAEVMSAVCDTEPRVIVYVSCDPATFARDAATARDCGYEIASLTAVDMFPMTGHIETVSILTRR
jgi:tRNA/tmRNA/rRNA uracil-C5-methylase (TrmA/RlmC/RlmD family)